MTRIILFFLFVSSVYITDIASLMQYLSYNTNYSEKTLSESTVIDILSDSSAQEIVNVDQMMDTMDEGYEEIAEPINGPLEASFKISLKTLDTLNKTEASVDLENSHSKPQISKNIDELEVVFRNTSYKLLK